MMTGALIAPISDAMLAAALAQSERLTVQATAVGLAFSLEELGDIDIPDVDASHIDRAQLRALATLYLAADLEPAGIIPSVETLAGLSASGGLQIDLGAVGPLVQKWWRKRNELISAAERSAFFSRLFGTASGPVAADADRNYHFEDRMLELCEALLTLDEVTASRAGGLTAQQTRIHAAARNLAQNLAGASGGITAYLASEIIIMLKDAFAIVGNPSLRGVFGARDVWGVVGGISRLARIPVHPAPVYVRRGKAGMTVLSWLAETVSTSGANGPSAVTAADPVVSSAIEWLQATLEIGESNAALPSLPAETGNSRNGNIPSWSSLGG